VGVVIQLGAGKYHSRLPTPFAKVVLRYNRLENDDRFCCSRCSHTDYHVAGKGIANRATESGTLIVVISVLCSFFNFGGLRRAPNKGHLLQGVFYYPLLDKTQLFHYTYFYYEKSY